MEELIPAVERQYRGIGEGWARGVFGGSTGGWESLAAQVFYPDEFNYAAAACPDPIGFESYVTVGVELDLWISIFICRNGGGVFHGGFPVAREIISLSCMRVYTTA